MPKLTPKGILGAAVFVGAAAAHASDSSRFFPSASHPLLSAYTESFELRPVDGISLKPECLRRNGLDLIVLEPGHDDSERSRRSEAKRCSTCPDEFLRPLIHEGQTNQAVAWMAYDLMLKDSSLSAAEREELRSMIRFSRLPGEREFGEYEKEEGYAERVNGPITSDTTNRLEHVNYMMSHHRRVPHALEDVTGRTLIQMVHANSSGFYDRADYLWIMRPQAMSDKAWSYFRSLARGFESEMASYFRLLPGDNDVVRGLKDAVRPTYAASRTMMNHYAGSRMLGPLLGNGQTVRALAEGFFMDGRAGNLVYRELSSPNHSKYLRFERDGRQVARYIISDLYVNYARSIVRGISNEYGCGAVSR